MSVSISSDIQSQLASLLLSMEERSELERCVVVTRSGIKVAPDMDADTYSASSAALIDLGERVVSSLTHGILQELVINALGGYVILVAIGDKHMLLGATAAALKMGYYLPYLRKMAWELEMIIHGEAATQFATQAIEEEEERDQEPTATPIDVSELKAADMAAMDDVLAAFDDFGVDDDFSSSFASEDTPIVGISENELNEINKFLQAEEKPLEDLSMAASTPVKPALDSPVSHVAEGAGGGCPIPLEPGEVAPYPLPPEELNPFGEPGVQDAPPAPTEKPAPAIDPMEDVAPPAPIPSQPVPPSAPAHGVQSQAPAPVKDFSLDTELEFGEASEYDFGFDMDDDKRDDVVIEEDDSMSEALKALGWEEDE